MNIGFFVSSHGFGHAARASAVMQKLWEQKPGNFYIYTSTPEWFFHNSLRFPFEYIRVQTDVGLVQSTPFEEDIEKTITSLQEFLPFSDLKNSSLVRELSQKKLDLIFCDISPLGLWVAQRLGIPAVLIENFTWNWIYEYYLDEFPQLNKFIPIFQEMYQIPDLHFSCEPYCNLSEKSIIVPPVFREPRSTRGKIRNQLGVNEDEFLILVTLGGIPIDQEGIKRNQPKANLKFLIPVNHIQDKHSDDTVIYLPHNHPYFHPDLVNASNLVIGKLGYSTIAEVSSMGKPFLFIGRKNFRESKVLSKFVLENLLSYEVELDSIFSFQTTEKIMNLLSNTRVSTIPVNGAEQIVDLVLNNYL